MSEVFASAAPAPASPPPELLELPPELPLPVSEEPVDDEEESSSEPHAVSATASPAAPAAAMTLRRAGVDAD
jgi:hypothetical protein